MKTAENKPESVDEAVHLCKQSKEEIAGKALFSQKDKTAFLSALIFSAGSLLIHGGNVSLTISTQNEALPKTVRALSECVAGRSCRMTAKGKTQEILIENALPLLTRCKVLDTTGGTVTVCDRIAPELIGEQSTAVAYVRGAYLGAGSLSAGKYHLEFSFGKRTLAEDFAALLHRFEVSAKVAVRAGRAVVYTKDSGSIGDCLALMGANVSALKFHSLLVTRQMSEHLNRQQNCDMHNIDKQVDTGLKQCVRLKELDTSTLSPPLRAAAEARLAHPDYSYEQLGALLGISKSGAKNRLRRLCALVAETEIQGGTENGF